MHTLRYWALSALVAVTLSVGACTTTTQQQQLQDACNLYTRTLDVLAGYAAEGELNDDQIETVENARVVLNEVCFGPVTNYEDAMNKAVSGVQKLLTVQKDVQ